MDVYTRMDRCKIGPKYLSNDLCGIDGIVIDKDACGHCCID